MISIADLRTHAISQLDLRPGKSVPPKRGIPGGEYPFWVVIKGNEKAYVSSLRDREIVVINLAAQPTARARELQACTDF
jgi:hypothetical protein